MSEKAIFQGSLKIKQFGFRTDGLQSTPSFFSAQNLTFHLNHLKFAMLCPHCHQEIQTYRNPVPTVDIIIEIEGAIVLIKRKNPPHGWALPGGFVDYGESYETAAQREAKEETGLVVKNMHQFRTYSAPNRDPRQHTASTVFIAQADTPPTAGDDAAEAALFNEENLPHLVFDHALILSDYFAFKKEKS